MIYLIGGPPKCGKTTLAKTLSKTLGMPWVSTDTLQNVIKPYMGQNDLTTKFPVGGQRCGSNDEKYGKYSAHEIINAYTEQAKTVYRAIEMFAECEIADGNDFIIEGYHVEPELVAGLSKKFEGKIKSIFLIKLDQELFVQNIRKSTTPNDWIIARTKNEDTYGKIAAMISEYSKYFEKESEKYSCQAINMDVNFSGKLVEAIDLLCKV
ncbi:MAG: AAA family ATPase [Candidatus Berkelbacteria bacterium]